MSFFSQNDAELVAIESWRESESSFEKGGGDEVANQRLTVNNQKVRICSIARGGKERW